MMQPISEIMTRNVSVISPEANLQQAAQMMRDQDVGSLPVCNGKRLVGVITDRDIAIRAMAQGKAPSDCQVKEVMSPEVFWCFEDQTPGEVLQQMGDRQVRRIPVINRNMELTGIVSLGDLALRDDAQVSSTLEEISEPVPPVPKNSGRQPTARS